MITRLALAALRSLLAAVLVVLATGFAYGVTLAWDQEYDVAPDGSKTGPYSTWQVALLVVMLCAIVGYAAWRHHAVVGAVVTTLAFTTLWSREAMQTDDSGLWGVGALMILVGGLIGFSFFALLVAVSRAAFAEPAAPAPAATAATTGAS